ncbi:MAG: hypothetical protein H6747_17000 [Deltaproteobacteria bacterium]|nr:hypothetical protein [Deltaproteobacteria bacterium]
MRAHDEARVALRLCGVALLLLAVTLGPAAWQAGYVLDDRPAILENPLAHWPPQPSALLHAPWFGPAPAWRDQGVSRPLTTLLFALEDGVGLGSRGRHLVSLLLAALGIGLFGALVARGVALAGRAELAVRAGLLTTLLAALHPTHVEAIVGVANRPEPLAALLLVLAGHALLAAGPARWWAVLCFGAALLAKESAIAALAPAALWVFARRDRRAGAVVAAMVALAAGWLAFRLSTFPLATPSAIDNALAGTPTWVRLRGGFYLVAAAAGRLALPFGLAPDYSLDVLPVRDPPLAGWLAGAALSLAVAALLLRQGRAALRGDAGALGVALALLAAAAFYGPVSQLPFAATLTTADRVLWMPQLALAGLGGVWSAGWWQRADVRRRRVLVFVLAAVGLAWAASATETALDWRTPESLAARGVQLAPRSVKMRYNLGRLRLEAGDPAAAAEHFEVARAIAPQDAATEVLLAQALTRLGDCARGTASLARLAALPQDRGLRLARLDLGVRCGAFAAAADAASGLRAPDPALAERIYIAAIGAGDAGLAARAARAAGVEPKAEPRWVAAAVFAEDRAGRPAAALARLLDLAAARPDLPGLATQIRRRCDKNQEEGLRQRCADSWRGAEGGGR